MYSENPSPKRKALRAKYRKKHGDDWWQDGKIKARFDKEIKKTPKGSFTRGGKPISEPAASKSRGRGKKPFASKEIVDEFIDYAYGFYGRGGVWGMNTTKTQLRAATKEYIKAFEDKNADYRYVVEKAFSKIPKSFDGDTIDRENVAVIVEDMYGKKKPSERFSGKKSSSRKGTRKISKPKDIYDKVYNQLLKHLDPLVPKGISGPSWFDAEVVSWQLGDESVLIMTDNKDEWFFEIIPDKKGINQVSLILGNRSKLTPTKIAKEVVQLYRMSKDKPTKRRKR